MSVAATRSETGSSAVQGALWGVHVDDWVNLQESHSRGLYEDVRDRPQLRSARTLLDVGCGAGLAALVFSERIPAVSGIDASKAFIEFARRRLPKADFRVGEMEQLPFADASFDAVTGFNSFQYAQSPVQALREARRVARPGGVVVIATWGEEKDCQASRYIKALGSFLPPPPPGTPGPFALSDRERLTAFAAQAGLTAREFRDVDVVWPFADLDQAQRALRAAGPAVKAAQAAGRERVDAAIADAISPYRDASGGYRLTNRFRYLVATT
jgi:SAM-dependent methyltransferase